MAAIFRKAFRDSRRSTLWLSIGFGLYVFFIMAFYPSIKDQADEWQKLIDSYPEGVLAMFYGEDMADFDMTEPGTWVQTEFGSYSVLILGAIVIAQAFNAFTNAERDGTLDMLLSLPVSRRRYLLGRALNTAVVMALVLAACLAGFLASMLIWPEFDASVVNLALSMVGAFLFLMVVAGYTYLLAVAVPSSRRFAGAIAYLLLIGSFLVYGFSAVVDALEPIQPLLLQHYFNMGTVIRDGAQLGDWAVMAVTALIYFALAWWLVDRKELGV
ncbi:MAG: ABC transporter permease subunit [Chloroflexota bacterium]|jgi:ABC-type transport system involved in multi-copper enzyme maturation permease subunit